MSESAQGMSTSSQVDLSPSDHHDVALQRRWKQFSVPPETFKKFEVGRNKFERWSKFLDLNDQGQAEVYEYAKANKDATIVLKCCNTGALRAIRRRAANGA